MRPQPSLAELGDLVAEHRAAGLPVRLEVQGPPRPLPDGVELSAYRIVAGGADERDEARAAERCGGHGGVPRLAPGHRGGRRRRAGGAGQGLVGMRERVALLGGELEAGRAAGGYRVAARLPVGDDDPAAARRRPGARAHGLPAVPRDAGGPGGRGRGGGRRGGGRARPGAAPGRRADGRPHAADGRRRGDAPCDRARAAGARAGADDVRPRRVRVRRAAGGRRRVPAQGRAAGAAAGGDPGRARRRGAALPVGHAAADRGVRGARRAAGGRPASRS